MSMKFNDCYKVIITDICEYNLNWQSRDSKWLDECDLSNDSLIELIDWDLKQSRENLPTYGTVMPTSIKYCYPLPLISTASTTSVANPLDSFARMAYGRIGAYFGVEF